jgi:hypothetical protein
MKPLTKGQVKAVARTMTDYHAVFSDAIGQRVLRDILKKTGVFAKDVPNTPEAMVLRNFGAGILANVCFELAASEEAMIKAAIETAKGSFNEPKDIENMLMRAYNLQGDEE